MRKGSVPGHSPPLVDGHLLLCSFPSTSLHASCLFLCPNMLPFIKLLVILDWSLVSRDPISKRSHSEVVGVRIPIYFCAAGEAENSTHGRTQTLCQVKEPTCNQYKNEIR